MTERAAEALRAIKLAHTVVWAFFVGAIAGVPISAWLDRYDWTLICTGLVLVEVAVLAVNRMRCPLTAVAARYTSDRRDNFDIYLPEWLARWNKHIFGALFLGGVMFALFRWLRRGG